MVAEWDTLRDAVGIHDNAGSTGELRAVREALADARATVGDLRARLDDATKQNATMARIAEHAQVLHAMETRDKSKRPSLMNRLRALLGGGYENQLNRMF